MDRVSLMNPSASISATANPQAESSASQSSHPTTLPLSRVSNQSMVALARLGAQGTQDQKTLATAIAASVRHGLLRSNTPPPPDRDSPSIWPVAESS